MVVAETISGLTAGYAPPSAKWASDSIFLGDVAARYTNSALITDFGLNTANPVLPVSPSSVMKA